MFGSLVGVTLACYWTRKTCRWNLGSGEPSPKVKQSWSSRQVQHLGPMLSFSLRNMTLMRIQRRNLTLIWWQFEGTIRLNSENAHPLHYIYRSSCTVPYEWVNVQNGKSLQLFRAASCSWNISKGISRWLAAANLNTQATNICFRSLMLPTGLQSYLYKFHLCIYSSDCTIFVFRIYSS